MVAPEPSSEMRPIVKKSDLWRGDWRKSEWESGEAWADCCLKNEFYKYGLDAWKAGAQGW
jgi:hypothetical protein